MSNVRLTMIVGVMETGDVKIYASMENVLHEWGPYPTDLASDVIILFDEDGTWLKPIEHYTPCTWYRWNKKLKSVDLNRAKKEEETHQDSLSYLLHHEVTSLVPNAFVKTLDELRERYPWQQHS